MHNHVLLRLLDYVFVTRPLILIPAWSFYLMGAAEGAKARPSWRAIPSPTAFLTLTLILITAYLLNQIFDRESDALNNKCHFLPRGIFQVRTLTIMAVAAFVAASIGFQRVDAVQRWPLFAALFLSLVYSLPPLRLCARPFTDMVVNAIGYGGLAFVLGFTSFSSELGAGIGLSVPYVLLVAATFLHTTILDIAGDRATGKISTAVLIGEHRSAALAVALHGLGVGVALVSHNYYALVITAGSLPVTLYASRAARRDASSLHVQVMTLVVTLGAIARSPGYAMIVGPLILLSRYYHRRRFGVTYPGPSSSA